MQMNKCLLVNLFLEQVSPLNQVFVQSMDMYHIEMSEIKIC